MSVAYFCSVRFKVSGDIFHWTCVWRMGYLIVSLIPLVYFKYIDVLNAFAKISNYNMQMVEKKMAELVFWMGVMTTLVYQTQCRTSEKTVCRSSKLPSNDYTYLCKPGQSHTPSKLRQHSSSAPHTEDFNYDLSALVPRSIEDLQELLRTSKVTVEKDRIHLQRSPAANTSEINREYVDKTNFIYIKEKK